MPSRCKGYTTYNTHTHAQSKLSSLTHWQLASNSQLKEVSIAGHAFEFKSLGAIQGNSVPPALHKLAEYTYTYIDKSMCSTLAVESITTCFYCYDNGLSTAHQWGINPHPCTCALILLSEIPLLLATMIATGAALKQCYIIIGNRRIVASCFNSGKSITNSGGSCGKRLKAMPIS